MIDIAFEVDCPEDAAGVLDAAVSATLVYGDAQGEVALLVTDDAGIHRMNREFRGIDRATDVLSFPAGEEDGGFLGDIAISLERARAQAAEYGHPLARELSFLAVHGTLHLLGYDHIGEGERAEMFGIQEKILDKMGMKR